MLGDYSLLQQDAPSNKRSHGALGYQDDMQSQKRIKTLQPPSRVLHARNLPMDCSDADLSMLASPFGKVVNILLLRAANQAFIQMQDQIAATAMVEYYSANPANIRGHTVYFQYSSREEITAPSSKQNESRNSILLITITNVLYPITLEVLHAVFSRYGTILKIVTFTSKNGSFQVLVQYPDSESAATAKAALDGQNIYVGCCTLKIQFSNMTVLDVKFNNDKSRDYTNPNLPAGPAPGTMPSSAPSRSSRNNNSLGQMNSMSSMNQMGGMNSMSGLNALSMDPFTGLYNQGASSFMNPSFTTGGVGTPSGNSVVIVSGLAETVTPDVLFTLFGVYGDVQVVKILYNKKDTALVQMAAPQQAEFVISYLNGCALYGNTLHINLSKHSSIHVNRNPTSEQDGANYTKEYTNSPLHRYKKAGSKNFQHICPPGPTLHISNIPPTLDEEAVTNLFRAYGEVRAFKFFATDRKMALVQMGNTAEAVQALIGVHNLQPDPSLPNQLRVSFAKATIKDNAAPHM